MHTYHGHGQHLGLIFTYPDSRNIPDGTSLVLYCKPKNTLEYVGSKSPPIFNRPMHSILSRNYGPRASYPGLDPSPKTAETPGL